MNRMSMMGMGLLACAGMALAAEETTPAEQLPAAFKHLNAAVQVTARNGRHKLNIANGLCLTGGDVSKEFVNEEGTEALGRRRLRFRLTKWRQDLAGTTIRSGGNNKQIPKI